MMIILLFIVLPLSSRFSGLIRPSGKKERRLKLPVEMMNRPATAVARCPRAAFQMVMLPRCPFNSYAVMSVPAAAAPPLLSFFPFPLLLRESLSALTRATRITVCVSWTSGLLTLDRDSFKITRAVSSNRMTWWRSVGRLGKMRL